VRRSSLCRAGVGIAPSRAAPRYPGEPNKLRNAVGRRRGMSLIRGFVGPAVARGDREGNKDGAFVSSPSFASQQPH